jgi:hypothetical protein
MTVNARGWIAGLLWNAVLATKLIHLERQALDISTDAAPRVLISERRTARDSVAINVGTPESCKVDADTTSRPGMLKKDSLRGSDMDRRRVLSRASLFSSKGKVVHIA